MQRLRLARELNGGNQNAQSMKRAYEFWKKLLNFAIGELRNKGSYLNGEKSTVINILKVLIKDSCRYNLTSMAK